MKLYCYDGEDAVMLDEGNPHAVVLELDEIDYARLDAARREELLGVHEIGTWVRVTDRETGREYEVASAPCGAPCRCAAVAREVIA